MYATAAAHFGIVVRGLFKDEKQSQVYQNIAISCLSDPDPDYYSAIQCTTSATPLYDLPESAVTSTSLVLDALLAVNVSKTIRRLIERADVGLLPTR